MSLRDYLGGTPDSLWHRDVVVAGMVFVFALALFPIRFYVSQVLVHTIPVVIGVASGGYLVLRRFELEGAERTRWELGAGMGHVIRLGFVVGLAAMVFVGTITGGRTVAFFAVTGLVGALLFLQIVLLRESALDPVPILVQVVAFALVVRWMALLTTPGLIGVDAWRHLPDYAASIRSSGSLWAIADSKYFAAPLYHALVVVAADALGTSLQTALYATLGLVMPLSVLLMYYTGRLVLPVRWALFAAATFSVADHVVRWGLHVIPTSMGLVFFLGIFYGVTRAYDSRSMRPWYALVMLFAVATILTHQISTFILLLFLGVGAVVQVYARVSTWRFVPDLVVDDGGHVNFVALFLAVLPLTVADWMFAPRSGGRPFLTGMLDSSSSSLTSASFLALESVKTVDTGPIESILVSVPLSVQMLNSIGFLLLLLISLVGSFALLRHRSMESLPLSWLSFSGVMLFVVMGLPLFGLYFLIPMRWYAFLYVPLVMLAAYGVQYLEMTMPARGLVAALVVFSLVFPGAMLVNNKATHDDPVADDYYSQLAYTESELAAADTISTMHPEDEALRTDHPYFLYFRNAKLETAMPVNVSSGANSSGTHVVYREVQTTSGPRAESRGEMVRVKLSEAAVCRPSMDVLYSNGDVRYCREVTG
jgi:hypothetical protein